MKERDDIQNPTDALTLIKRFLDFQLSLDKDVDEVARVCETLATAPDTVYLFGCHVPNIMVHTEHGDTQLSNAILRLLKRPLAVARDNKADVQDRLERITRIIEEPYRSAK